MAYELSGDPRVQYRNFAGVSKFSAVHQPMGFYYFRRDFFFSETQDNGGKAKFITAGDFELSDAPVGSFIEVKFSNSYNGIHEVIESNPPYEITVNTDFVDASEGYGNFGAHKNWFLRCQIQRKDNADVFQTIGILDIQHDSNWYAICDPYSLFKNTVVYTDKNDYVTYVYTDKEESGVYRVVSTEWFNGVEFGAVITSDEFNYTNSAMQLQNLYGSNLAKFVLHDTVDLVPKLLGDFDTPTFFTDYPFSISLLSNYELQENEIYTIKNSTGSGQSELPLVNGYLNRVNFNSLLVSEEIDFTSMNRFVITAYNTVEFEHLPLCSPQYIDIDSNCRKSPVYLNWLSTDGSRNYWLFEDVQELLKDVKGGNSYEVPLKNTYDLQDMQTKVVELSRSAQPKLTVQATLHVDKVKCLHKITNSMNVLMHMGFDEYFGLHKWQQVYIEGGSFRICDTTDSTATIELTLILDSINIQAQ